MTLLPSKIYDIGSYSNIIALTPDFQTGSMNFLLPDINRAYILSINSDLVLSVRKQDINPNNIYDSVSTYDFIAKSLFQNDTAYIDLSIINQNSRAELVTFNAIIKTDPRLTKYDCDGISFEAKDQVSNDQTFYKIVYSPNGTSQNEIHWFDSGLNAKYLNNFDLFHDLNLFVNHSETDITLCIWPNYLPLINT